jgi:hypothetical protein
MNKHHDIKCWPQFEKDLRDGTKTFEMRVNDRDYQQGDTFRLRFYDPVKSEYMDEIKHPPIDGTVGYVLKIDKERVVWSILK